MAPKVYIDGKEGTTGLQIYDRLAGREDIQLLLRLCFIVFTVFTKVTV